MFWLGGTYNILVRVGRNVTVRLGGQHQTDKQGLAIGRDFCNIYLNFTNDCGCGFFHTRGEASTRNGHVIQRKIFIGVF